MSEIVKKVLRSGLIDKHTAELMEQYGMLDPGAAETVNDDALKNATQVQMKKLAEELAVEVEREHKIRETYLDLDRTKFPVTVKIFSRGGHFVTTSGMVDRHGRYYFRFQDADPNWFTPGFLIEKVPTSAPGGETHDIMLVQPKEMIVEATPLFVDEKPVAYQVSTQAA